MRNLICVMVVLFLADCATVSHGPMQRIQVSSEPTGASVQLRECGVGSSRSAKTPATVYVNRGATLCTMTFTLPEYGSRTVPLFRRWSPAMGKNVDAVDRLCNDDGTNCTNSLTQVVGVVIVAATAFGVDKLTGAMYEQNRSRILVDFNKPIPNVAGRYSLVAVNGKALPATTWTTRNGKCQIWTTSGSVVVKDDGRWSLASTEQEFCGEEKRSPVESTAHGVVTFDDQGILLESEDGASPAVLDGDRLEVTVRGSSLGLGLGESQTAVYTFWLSE